MVSTYVHAYMHAWNIPGDLCTYHQQLPTSLCPLPVGS